MTLTTSEKYKRERDKKRKKNPLPQHLLTFTIPYFIVTSIMIPTGYHYTWLSEEMLMMGYHESRMSWHEQTITSTNVFFASYSHLYSALNQMRTQIPLVKKWINIYTYKLTTMWLIYTHLGKIISWSLTFGLQKGVADSKSFSGIKKKKTFSNKIEQYISSDL